MMLEGELLRQILNRIKTSENNIKKDEDKIDGKNNKQ